MPSMPLVLKFARLEWPEERLVHGKVSRRIRR